LPAADGRAEACLLVLMGSTAAGKNELVAILDGYRESEQSWHELLVDLKHLGLRIDPKLAVGDGAPQGVSADTCPALLGA